MNFETIDNVSIRCNDCLEVMDKEQWFSHYCGNNYRVVEANKTMCNDCSYTGESRINAVCIECQKLMSEPVITRAHLRTLAKMVVVMNPFDTPDEYLQNVDDLITYAIENPTEE